MKQNLSILALLLIALVAVVSGQNPISPGASAPAAQTKPDAAADIKVASAPYHAAVETVSAEYQKWVTSLETWYLAELDKLQAARAKLGDLDGAIAIKKERERMASHSPTTPEQIQAMPAPLRTLRAGYDQGLKKSADEGTRRIDVARRKYLADLEALQKRITTTGDIDKALLVKAEKDRFIAEMAAGPGAAISPPPPPPVIPMPAIPTESIQKAATIPHGPPAATDEKQRLDVHEETEMKRFEGSWTVFYRSIGTTRGYRINASGQVEWAGKVSQISKRGNDFMLDFNDGKLERMSIKGTELVVEHFNPSSRFPNLGPNTVGSGEKVK